LSSASLVTLGATKYLDYANKKKKKVLMLLKELEKNFTRYTIIDTTTKEYKKIEKK